MEGDGYNADKANIGILTICKQKNTRTEDGKLKRIPHPNMKEVPGGIPAIIPVALFERAQRKLAANREQKSHLPRNLEEYLLWGHIYCATCGYKMGSKFHQNHHYYYCRKFGNNYAKCPDMPVIITNTVDKAVWDDCCQLFERIDLIQARIEEEIERSIASLLEDTTGQEHILNLKAAIDYAQQERSKHLEGSYYYQLITQDIQAKMNQLQRYEEECQSAKNIATATASYKERVVEFFDFIHEMKGRYHDATYQEKRNALDVLDVKVYIKTIKKGTGGRHHNGEKSIEITYSPQLPGINTSLHAR